MSDERRSSSKTRARRFRAPLVITLAGCASHAPPAPPHPHPHPRPHPRPTSHVVFRDPSCVRVSPDDVDQEVECPDALLPPAPSDRLIVHSQFPIDGCYEVHRPDDTELHRVRCPPGGPTVITSDRDVQTRRHVSIRIDEHTLGCEREVFANPPYWKPIDRCPTALLPTLAHGVKPTREEHDHCYWGDFEVQCDPPRDAGGLAGIATITAQVIAFEPHDTGATITLNRGRNQGVDVGSRGAIVGLRGGDFTVSKVTERASVATVAASVDQVKASRLVVEVETADVGDDE
jgi:hypothetical protein